MRCVAGCLDVVELRRGAEVLVYRVGRRQDSFRVGLLRPAGAGHRTSARQTHRLCESEDLVGTCAISRAHLPLCAPSVLGDEVDVARHDDWTAGELGGLHDPLDVAQDGTRRVMRVYVVALERPAARVLGRYHTAGRIMGLVV